MTVAIFWAFTFDGESKWTGTTVGKESDRDAARMASDDELLALIKQAIRDGNEVRIYCGS